MNQHRPLLRNVTVQRCRRLATPLLVLNAGQVITNDAGDDFSLLTAQSTGRHPRRSHNAVAIRVVGVSLVADSIEVGVRNQQFFADNRVMSGVR